MFEEFDQSYEFDENFICYLCGLPIPINVYRGTINKKANLLSLQIDHVTPRKKGGRTIKNNLKPTHRFCNGSKNQWDWSKSKEIRAHNLIKKYLLLPIEKSWEYKIKVDEDFKPLCCFEDCEKRALAGIYHQYCQKHAILMGEQINRSPICAYKEYTKQSRTSGSGYCVKHAKMKGIIPTENFCIIEGCNKQVQRAFSNKYCQKHSRKFGLVNWDVKPGLKNKAAHIGTHKVHHPRDCFWCVDIEKRTTYLEYEEVEEWAKKIHNLSPRKITDKFHISRRGGKHFYEIYKKQHESDKCLYCISLKENQDFYLK